MNSFFRRHKLFVLNLTSASGILALGDVLVQILYEKKDKLDDQRVLAALVTGGVLGIEGHIWYTFLDRLIVSQAWHNVFKKVMLDQIIAAPVYTLTYIVGTSTLEGRTSSHEVITDVKTSFIPLYLVDCCVYSPVQTLNFKYIPAFYRIPFLSATALLFDTFITAYKHQHESMHTPNSKN